MSNGTGRAVTCLEIGTRASRCVLGIRVRITTGSALSGWMAAINQAYQNVCHCSTWLDARPSKPSSTTCRRLLRHEREVPFLSLAAALFAMLTGILAWVGMRIFEKFLTTSVIRFLRGMASCMIESPRSTAG